MSSLIKFPGGLPLTGFYYPEMKRDLLLFFRANKDRLGLSDENDFEVHIALYEAFCYMAHLNNTRVDTLATELYLDSAQLRESIRKLLGLMGVKLNTATPSVADLVMKLSAPTTADINAFIPALSDFESDSVPPIIFESPEEDLDLDRTDRFLSFLQLQQLPDDESGSDISVSVGSDYLVRGSGTWPADVVGSIITLVGSSILSNSGDYNVISRVDDQTIRVSRSFTSQSPSFQTEVGISWWLREFSGEKAFSINAGTGVDVFDNTPSVGDKLYICHQDVMMTSIDFTFNSFGNRIKGVWEYYDSDRSKFNPTSVYNNGSTLSFDLTSILGSIDRSGCLVEVELVKTGNKEYIQSLFGAKTGLGSPAGVQEVNYVETSALLSQENPSTFADEYFVTSLWLPFDNYADDTNDGTGDLAQDGAVSWDLPQTQLRNWKKSTINEVEARWLRFRVVEDAGAGSVSEIATADITAGDQYISTLVNQGESIIEQILGTSTGLPFQQFRLLDAPFIGGSQTISVDESGAGSYTEWEEVESWKYSSSTDRHYVVDVNKNDEGVIEFGDGVNGMIPPVYPNNIRADVYRIGGEVDGNVGAGVISRNLDGLNQVSEVFNPRVARGWRIKDGGDKVDIERLRRSGPADFRSRSVGATGGDVEFLAVNDFEDSDGVKVVARAKVSVGAFGPKKSKLLVVGVGATVLNSDKISDLELYFNGDRKSRPPVDGKLVMNQEIGVVNFEPIVINVEATVAWDRGNAAIIKEALLTYLHPLALDNSNASYFWDFGDKISLSKLYSLIHSLDPNITNIPVLNISKGSETLAGLSVNLSENELPVARSTSINITIVGAD